MASYIEVDRCRVCGNQNLIEVLSLGVQALTGVFPKTKSERVTSGPVDLVKCAEDSGGCGLVQLRQSYDKNEMYGGHYGYRSGLNGSMVRHLEERVRSVLRRVKLNAGDLVVDIGSNDATLLKAYPSCEVVFAGIDPTAKHFAEYYPSHIQVIPDFFSAEALRRRFGAQKAKIVTSMAMFYDLDSPMEFVAQVRDALADDGVWMFEQSYLPTMVERNAYDTVCHEHLEYYALKQIRLLMDRAGLKILDVELNDINGGSFCVTAAKKDAPYAESTAVVARILKEEEKYSELAPFRAFRDSVFQHREELLEFLRASKKEKKTVAGYGASTKGNVILQFCGITENDVPRIGEINQDKFGCYTPGTLIPIVPESVVKAERPDILFVLPWHFRKFIIEKESDYLRSGGKLFFPLPKPDIF